jgi:hypothetical protein
MLLRPDDVWAAAGHPTQNSDERSRERNVDGFFMVGNG